MQICNIHIALQWDAVLQNSHSSRWATKLQASLGGKTCSDIKVDTSGQGGQVNINKRGVARNSRELDMHDVPRDHLGRGRHFECRDVNAEKDEVSVTQMEGWDGTRIPKLDEYVKYIGRTGPVDSG